MSCKAQFNDVAGNELIKPTSAFQGSTMNWSSESFNKNADASNYYYNNKSSILNKIARERIDEAMAQFNSYANHHIGFPSTINNYQLWLIDNKSHPEKEAMSIRWKALKPILEGITANEFSEDDRSKVQVMIDYFNGLKTQYIKDEKGDKKIRYACYYNCALLYMILDKCEEAANETEGLIKNDYDIKDGESLRKKSDELLELFKKNGINSRHFSLSENRPYSK